MQQKTTWMSYLGLIGNIFGLGLFVTMVSCGRVLVEEFVSLTIQIVYINDTNSTIKIGDGGSCGFDEGNAISDFYTIEPQDTLILNRTNPEYMGTASINNISLYQGGGCRAMYMENEGSVCTGFSQGFYEVTNYENRKKTGKNSFEFTYRFTDETKAAAVACE